MKFEKELVYAWMNKQIKSNKLETATLFDNMVVRHFRTDDIQLHRGIKLISDITGIPYTEREWCGNQHCGVNYIERSLMYNGFKFFTLGTVEDFRQEDSENEKAKITD